MRNYGPEVNILTLLHELRKHPNGAVQGFAKKVQASLDQEFPDGVPYDFTVSFYGSQSEEIFDPDVITLYPVRKIRDRRVFEVVSQGRDELIIQDLDEFEKTFGYVNKLSKFKREAKYGDTLYLDGYNTFVICTYK